LEDGLILKKTREIRKNHSKLGTRKLYTLLKPFLMDNKIKMGRDSLFNLLSENHLLIKTRKRKVRTTNSYHMYHKYPNLIRNIELTGPNQLWVSDITYWRIETGKYLYVSLITDAYSRKIVGFHVAETMETKESIIALQMAISALGADSHLHLIHHSDRGIQYCSHSYIKLLKGNIIGISMTENGDPLENAIAERINGIVKQEYLETYKIENVTQAKKLLKRVVQLYNNERPHMSLNNCTPNSVHNSKTSSKPDRLWKNYYGKKTTFANQEQD
jgi:transposase InsO family protein